MLINSVVRGIAWKVLQEDRILALLEFWKFISYLFQVYTSGSQLTGRVFSLYFTGKLSTWSLSSRMKNIGQGERRIMWQQNDLVMLGVWKKIRSQSELPFWRRKIQHWGLRWQNYGRKWENARTLYLNMRADTDPCKQTLLFCSLNLCFL